MQRRKERIAQVSHLTSLEEIESCVGKLFFGGENEGKNGRLGRLAYPLHSPVPVIPVHPPHRSHEGRSLQLLVPGPSFPAVIGRFGSSDFVLIQVPAMSFPKKENNDRNKNDDHLLLLSVLSLILLFSIYIIYIYI